MPTWLHRDGKLANKTALCNYFFLPVTFNFTQIPRCRNISATQIVSLARRQVLYRRRCQLNSGVNWNGSARLVIHVRLDSTGVDGEDLDVGILYKAMRIRRSITNGRHSPIVTNSAKRSNACFEMQYSLAFGIRIWDTPELRMTTCPLVFSNSGTAKLGDRR